MIGHLLCVYALVASNDASLPRAYDHWSARLHFLSYMLLILDFSVEMILGMGVSLADPAHLELHTYYGCDSAPEKEILKIKQELEEFALFVIVFRTVIGGAIATIYVLKASVVDDYRNEGVVADDARDGEYSLKPLRKPPIQ
ncbi:hypothetical protein B484DRAFT_455312 [Ochromonadaceae sp. CCMP2298]|nr:hypothetical protein B484DRAFT_455312 [Ochromonadaceae sp. CCMP2298]